MLCTYAALWLDALEMLCGSWCLKHVFTHANPQLAEHDDVAT